MKKFERFVATNREADRKIRAKELYHILATANLDYDEALITINLLLEIVLRNKAELTPEPYES